MADKRENEMQKASDGAFVRCLDASGNSVNVSKENFLENFQKAQAVNGKDADLNDFISTGNYAIIQATDKVILNRPTGVDGVLIVFKVSSEFILQIYMGYSSVPYFRVKWGTTWWAWKT